MSWRRNWKSGGACAVFKAAGLAAGSCKRLFCASSDACQALEPGGVCRFSPMVAAGRCRLWASMCFALCDKIGWPIEKVTRDSSHPSDAMGVLVGILLVGRE